VTKPCLTCGEPTDASRCPDHRLRHDRPSREELGYDYRWRKLAARAKRIQPWCSDCYTTDDLTVDHSERAWRRKAAGKPIRLRDVDVVCRLCNLRRGPARPRGQDPSATSSPVRHKPQEPSHTTGGYACQ